MESSRSLAPARSRAAERIAPMNSSLAPAPGVTDYLEVDY